VSKSTLPRREAVTADPLLTPEQVSEWTQFEIKTLANMRCRKTGPPYIKVGEGRNARVRYRRSAIEQWLSDRTVAA
jgi:predicted DNA-binding transcriptional regulator AlpA